MILSREERVTLNISSNGKIDRERVLSLAFVHMLFLQILACDWLSVEKMLLIASGVLSRKVPRPLFFLLNPRLVVRLGNPLMSLNLQFEIQQPLVLSLQILIGHPFSSVLLVLRRAGHSAH